MLASPVAQAQAQAQAQFQLRMALADVGELWMREALADPTRYVVVVVPGSGCETLASSADRMFRNLVHAQVWLLQKPNLMPAGSSASGCSAAFVQADDLASWRLGASRLIRSAIPLAEPDLPWVLVGMSEGAELIPHLASEMSRLALLVMVANAGLDPVHTAAMQARRMGQLGAWQRLMDQTRDWQPLDERVLHGRSARYWHGLQTWSLLEPVLADERFLLQVWGGRDALIPAAAYAEFADQARRRPAGYCAVRFAQADHELRVAVSTEAPAVDRVQTDRLQTIWRWIDTSARHPPQWSFDCASLQEQASTAD